MDEVNYFWENIKYMRECGDDNLADWILERLVDSILEKAVIEGEGDS